MARTHEGPRSIFRYTILTASLQRVLDGTFRLAMPSSELANMESLATPRPSSNRHSWDVPGPRRGHDDLPIRLPLPPICSRQH
jgi:hypothetical protein